MKTLPTKAKTKTTKRRAPAAKLDIPPDIVALFKRLGEPLPTRKYCDLSDLYGQWSDEEYAEFIRNLEESRRQSMEQQ